VTTLPASSRLFEFPKKCVAPAKAGTQGSRTLIQRLDSRLRGNDDKRDVAIYAWALGGLCASVAKRAFVPLAIALLAACVEKPPAPPAPERISLTKVSFAELPGWGNDAHEEALASYRNSCTALARRADGAAADARESCAAVATVPAGDRAAARAFFERWFQPYRAASSTGRDGLFTGYYEPELRGARQRSARYAVPLYIRPPDLVTVDLGEFRELLRGQRIAGRVNNGALRPYASRAEIEAGALANRGLELVWVDDAVDAFFLHIQGSGRVAMEDGSVFRVGYEAANGRAYTAIGGTLAARGALPREQVTMQSIRAWLAAHPDQAQALMQENASYVFFRENRGAGPLGALGVPLTPGRSLAVDRRFVTLGLPVWLDTTHPNDGAPLRRLVMAQDTGGAIAGAVRGDLFWGVGPQAADAAGRMQSRGGYYLLLPHGAVPGA